MNKLHLALALFILSVPFYAHADAYEGPFCFENPNSDRSGDIDHIRGTCKSIEKVLNVSLDPSLASEYFLGTHSLATAGCDPTGCGYTAKYSEHDILTSSSTLTSVHATSTNEDSGASDPASYSLFEKSFFVPILEKAFKNAGLSFSVNTMPPTEVNVFKPSELAEIQKNDFDYVGRNYVLNVLQRSAWGSWMYVFNTTDYQAYGAHIFGPKSEITESQYVDIKGKNPVLDDKNLGITSMSVYHAQYAWVVPVTSPLASVKDYWIFIKDAGKLVLKWQKSEYVLDDGSVRTVTSDDKNVSVALLFSKTPAASTTIVASSTDSNSSNAQVPEAKKSFFTRIIDFILSWFK